MNEIPNSNQLIQKLHRVLESTQTNEMIKIEQVRNAMLDFDSKPIGKIDSVKVSSIFDQYKEAYQFSKDQVTIKTGIPQYDNTYGGLVLGEFVVFGGRPAMGKSHLFVNLAVNIAAENEVLFYSLDLSSYMLTARVLSAITRFQINNYLGQFYSESQQKAIDLAQLEIDRLKLRIIDKHSQSMTAFKLIVKNHVETYGTKVLFVDYLQLLSSNRYKNYRELEMSYVSRELKNLARELNICVVASSQLSRSVETRGGDKRPILSDLRESGAIEQDADKVFFLYRPEYYCMYQNEDGESTVRQLELILSKNRNGPLANIFLKMDENYTTFVSEDERQGIFNFEQERLDELNPFDTLGENPF